MGFTIWPEYAEVFPEVESELSLNLKVFKYIPVRGEFKSTLQQSPAG